MADGVFVNIDALIKRGFMALEEGLWLEADGFFEQALNIDAENAEVYLGKLMAELKVHGRDEFLTYPQPFDDKLNYKRALRFGDAELIMELEGYNIIIRDRIEEKQIETVYINALKAMNFAKSEQQFLSAAEMFESISGYKDSAELIIKCREMAEIARKDEIYNRANMFFDTHRDWRGTSDEIDNLQESVALLEHIPDWRDSAEKIEVLKAKIDEVRVWLEQNQQNQEQRQNDEKLNAQRKEKLYKKIAFIAIPLVCFILAIVIIFNIFMPINSKVTAVKETISAGAIHTVGLKKDGTVVAVGDNEYGQCDIEEWEDIVAISAGYEHTVGLKKDGTVVAAGYSEDGQCDVGNWENIVAISAGYGYTVGLKKDGTMVAVGNNGEGQCNIENWEDIVAISAGYGYTVGLKKDGTVIAVGDNDFGQCDVDDWKNIVSVSAGVHHTVGLKRDGTVVAVGSNAYGQCDVEDLEDIVSISTGYNYTVGLKKDGRVIVVEDNDNDTAWGVAEEWEDMVSISTGYFHTVGLKEDGTAVAVGNHDYGKCSVDDWTDIKLP